MGKAKKGKTLGKEEEISDDEVEIQVSEDKPSQSSKKSKAEKNVDTEDEEQPKSRGKERKKKSKKVAESDNDAESDDEDSKPAKKKDKKKKGKAAESDSEEDESDVAKKAKSKKGKKAKNDSDDESEGVSTKADKKSKKKKKKGGDSSDEEVGAVKSSFALLSVEDDDSGGESPPPQPETDSEPEEVSTKGKGKKGNKPTPASQGGKKKKKKGGDDDDEDLDAMLAELALEYAGVKKEDAGEEEGGKKKKKKGKGADEGQDDEEADKKSKKKGKKTEEDGLEDGGDDEEGGTVKTAAQKKKEKKERQKQEKKEGKVTEDPKPKTEKKPEKKAPPPVEEVNEAEDGDDKKKKKKKGNDKDDDKGDKGKKGPAKKTIAAMQEALKKIREEEERMAKEEEERIQRIEAAEEAKREAAKLEQERKDKKKLKEKERKERLKAEGKLLTPKQKAERARAQALLEARKAQGLDLPNVGEKKPVRPGTRVRPSKVKSQTSQDKDDSVQKPDTQSETIQVEIVDKKEEKPKEPEDDVKDSWDAESSEEEEKTETETPAPAPAKGGKKVAEESSEDESSDEESESDSEEESSDSEESDSDTGRTDAERKREKALSRIQKRREEAEKNRTVKNLRAAVVCVLGHVDTGKTKILDKLRRTNVQDGEAGGITQQIGATNVPIDAIKEQVKIVKDFDENDLRIPGLLIIDTPGHESFSNLRNRGSSLCDIAILVVDIMHALEPQTIESINLLKTKKTPFVVALNKIDRLYDWQTMNRKDVRDIIKGQQANTQLEFEQRTKEVILQFAEQGLNAALFYENPDPRSYVSLVPTSAITGEGMGNILALIVDNCQNLLAKRLMYSDDLQATVLEVKAIPGLGTTIDCILVNGKLREGDTMIVAGTDGPVVTQIRSLLMPQPMKELRVKNAYVEYKEIKAAQGVKIAAKELEKAIAGLNLQVAQNPDEVEILKEEVARDLKSALSHVRLAERGVYVQASTLGSLEALLEFLKSSKIPYANIRIGPVVRKDVMKASIMLEHDSQFATILAFDVKVERDAQELADSTGVKIFQADIIYHLFDKFMAYREELKQRKRDEFKHIAVFPCKLRVLPQFVFNSRDPIVCGVMVEAGIVREGTPICVPSKEFVEVGIVTSVESNHKPVESARKGMEVCIKIEPVPGEAPKMFGRHFDETDMLVSKISRQSIDACKDYFRDDLNKQDWQLMVELKKTFEIL
ncbi:eukaryotic translation initiation factor 5B isoform X1 [Frankliniella occidentalis]|uniref:Eukaryotic translation initiation factor 5B n=1 Tax=Frankliniella occidentalis TaxID=133901 RepID=A0A9C6UDB0_FRAOC|nr:eukaryotic translation initiation factor 5B isoform X1 [Frankliniella occidentalis]